MIPLKTKKQQAIMQVGGKKLAEVMKQVLKEVRLGVKLADLDREAEKLIKKVGGRPSFKMVPGFSWASCLNLNEGVVHGVPSERKVKKGDLLSVDLGLFYQGLHTDMARTVIVGDNKDFKAEGFLSAGKKVLNQVVRVARPGNRIGHLSVVIESGLGKEGLFPVKDLTGHGIGKELHQKPSIPCFLDQPIGKTPLIKPGMTLAIEVIYTQKQARLEIEEDGWTVKTTNDALAGLFEDTILITNEGAEVLTKESSC